ncbi:MAG TPA: phosphoglycerate kinase [Gemmatimonadota bacterium]|nr:phosphoglycerate kinase [Gemmatimonadota bacterium]
MNRRSVRSLDRESLHGRRALVRVDYNVPIGTGGRIEDATRIEATLPSLRLLLGAGARPVLISHLGRPGGKVVEDLSLRPVAAALEELLGTPVRFRADTDTDEAVAATRALPAGEVMLLENTRFLPGETKNDAGLARRLARLGDVYVNDAFGSTHRAHASVVGVTEHLRPSVAGLLVEAELEALSRLREGHERPFVVAFGGAKISDKMPLVEAFVDRADTLLVGGALANTFLAAAGREVGRSLVEQEAVPFAREILERSDIELRLPVDLVVGVPGDEAGERRVVSAEKIPADMAAYDIGPDTRAEFAAVIRDARTFFWNGPMGWFEAEGYDAGTRAVAVAAAESAQAGAFCVIGGGDSARAVHEADLADRVSHVSTGGGAALEYLAHGTLPGLEALDEA